MRIFGRSFGKKAKPVKNEVGGAIVRQALDNFFQPIPSGTNQQVPSQIGGAIDLIAGRCAQIKLTSENSAVRDELMQTGNFLSPAEFWRGAVAHLLTNGNLLLIRYQERLHTVSEVISYPHTGNNPGAHYPPAKNAENARANTSGGDPKWRVRVPWTYTTMTLTADSRQIAMIRYGIAPIEEWLFAPRPYEEVIRRYEQLIVELIAAEYEITLRANKVSGSIKQTKAWQPDDLQYNLSHYKKELLDAQRGKTLGMLDGLEYQRASRYETNEHLVNLIDGYTRAVGHLYHIPIELMGIDARINRSAEQLDALFMRYAVSPIVASICAELSKIYGHEVMPERSLAGVTSDKSEAAMRLAQTGCVTGNEVRGMVGLPEDTMFAGLPATAGAPERSGSMQEDAE